MTILNPQKAPKRRVSVPTSYVYSQSPVPRHSASLKTANRNSLQRCALCKSPFHRWEYVLFWFSGQFPFRNPHAPDLVEKVDNDIVFLYAQAVKMLPHRIRQGILALSAEFSASRDRGRVDPDAPRLRKDPLMDGISEGCRSVQAVGSAVSMENVPLESGPLKLGMQGNVSKSLTSRNRPAAGREKSAYSWVAGVLSARSRGRGRGS